MGKIKKILENELIGGTQSTDVYPVTSIKAIYDENNERLDNIIKRKGVVNISTNYNDDHTAEVLTLAQAIAKVPTSDRVIGFSGTFLSSDGWESYQFIGSSISEWLDQTKWKPSIKVLQGLGNSTQFPVSQLALTEILKLSAPFILEQGDWDLTTRRPVATTKRVRTRFLIDSQQVFNVKTSTMEITVYPYTKEGIFLPEEVFWTMNLKLSPNRRYLLVFSAKNYTSDITVNNVLNDIEIIYNESTIGTNSVTDLHLEGFFSKGKYFDLKTNPQYTPGTEKDSGVASDFDCISIKVKAGDYFIVNNLQGGNVEARAYGIFNTKGVLIEVADELVELQSRRIDITEDGYIVFNTFNNREYVVVGNFNFFSDWNWQYMIPIMKEINLLSLSFKDFMSIPGNLSAEITQLQNDLYGNYTYKVGDTWDEGYIRVTDGGKPLNTPVSFSPLIMAGWTHLIIPCKQGDKFRLHVLNGGYDPKGWAFLNSDKYVISIIENADTRAFITAELVAPNGAAYLVTSTRKDEYTEDSWIEYGNKPVWDSGAEAIIKDKEIKILCFGNSFTQDSMSYVPFMLQNLAPNVKLTLGIAIIGGTSLVHHLANFTGENQTLNGTVYEPQNYYYEKNVNGAVWSQLGTKDVDTLLADEDWDIIVFQQGGAVAYLDWDTYFAPFIYKLHNSLFSKLGNGVKIGWLLTHGSYLYNNEDALKHWQGTAENSQKIMNITGNSIMFPYGTAVQNLRTTSLKALGDGSFHNLCADDCHLQEGIGCMTAAYANVLTILNCLGMGNVGVIGEQTRVDSNYVTNNKIPGPNLGTSGVIGVTDFNCYLAQVAAECAIKKPYEVTDMTHIESLT